MKKDVSFERAVGLVIRILIVGILLCVGVVVFLDFVPSLFGGV